jgi:hypothetical protein
MILYTRYSEYVLYVLYACMRTQLASPAESGMTIILGRLYISPTEAIRQGDRPYMQHLLRYGKNRVGYGTETREGRKLEIYTGDISPFAVSLYQVCSMSQILYI